MKIERAKQHINELNRAVTKYLTHKPFELWIRQSRNPNQRLVYVEAKEPIPEDFSLIVGDAVHNLRSAIDQLCWGMVGDKAKNPRSVGFPFVEREGALCSAINTRQMNVAPKKVIEEIHKLKPYPSGDKFLHAVKSLDETDKHRNILLVGLGVEFTSAQLRELISPHKLDVPDNLFISVVGDWAVQLGDDSPVEVFDRKADYQPPLTIGFGHGEALQSFPLSMALANMADATDRAVRSLAKAFFS